MTVSYQDGIFNWIKNYAIKRWRKGKMKNAVQEANERNILFANTIEKYFNGFGYTSIVLEKWYQYCVPKGISVSSIQEETRIERKGWEFKNKNKKFIMVQNFSFSVLNEDRVVNFVIFDNEAKNKAKMAILKINAMGEDGTTDERALSFVDFTCPEIFESVKEKDSILTILHVGGKMFESEHQNHAKRWERYRNRRIQGINPLIFLNDKEIDKAIDTIGIFLNI